MSTPSTENAVVDLIRRRGEVGREKYRTSMDRRDLSPAQWLQHFQEELADGLQYAERFKGACALLEEAAHIIGRAAVDSGRGLQWLAEYRAQFGEQPGQEVLFTEVAHCPETSKEPSGLASVKDADLSGIRGPLLCVDRPWSEYPLGTKAHSCTGGWWLRTEHGWQWNGKHGTFPTPGGEACGRCIELPPPNQTSA